jgi:hypothetical protein
MTPKAATITLAVMRSGIRPLLLAGVVGPPLFILVFIVEGLTRPGYGAWRNFVSQLATGDGGWVQTANFLVCGTLVACFAISLRLALGGGRASIAAPILMFLFASALIVAGVFATDPALGYPVGAPPTHTAHGMIHGLAGLAAFSLLPACALVMTFRFAGAPATQPWALYSGLVALVMIVTFIVSITFSTLDATGAVPNAPTGFVQRVAIIVGWTWISMVALRELRARRE